MNWDEQGGASRKSEVLSEHTFWMTPKSFCCIQDLYFNLQSNTIPYQRNGFITFSPMKFFSPIHWQTLKILGNGISQSFILSLKCDHPLLCKFSILFSTVKQWSTIDSTLGFWNVGLGLRIFPSFSQFIKEMGNWDFWKA